MEVSFHRLKGQYECDLRRLVGDDVRSKQTDVAARSAAQRDTLIGVLHGDIEMDDILPELELRLAGVQYKSHEMKRQLTADAARRIKRAAKSILERKDDPRTPWHVETFLPRKDILVKTGGEDVLIKDVEPDIIVTCDSWMYVYKVRTGAARKRDNTSYTAEDAAMDKQVYALLRYGAEYAREKGNKKTYIHAGFLFLKKRSDRAPSKSNPGNFDDDLFVNNRMQESDNVVTIMGLFDPKAGVSCGTDKTFAALFKKYAEGYSAEECTDEQCAECDFYHICKYEHAPKRVDGKKRGTELKALHLSGTQEEIELFQSGYALVNAVPGAGKTLVLVLRIVNLLNNDVKPEEIAIITFTNSGAEVFKDRIEKYNDEIGTGESVSGMVAATFNGLGQMILEKEYKSLGFTKPPRVIDQIERSSIIAELLNQYNIPDLDYRNFTTDMRTCMGPLAVASKVFEIMKSKGYTAFDAVQIIREGGIGAFCSVKSVEALAKVYDEYNAQLRAANLVEYADQEMILLDMLEKDPYYFDQYGWKHVLVDECQDTSENQFKILQYMTKTASFESLMVVGDDSQSIYGFRDTSPKFFMNFEAAMNLPEGTVQTFYMVDNYRSTEAIIEFANRLIERNEEKVVKEIVSKNEEGDAVRVRGFFDQDDELDFILEEIKKELQSGTKHEDIAFIAANRTELSKMASRLTDAGIPSVMLNPERYLENSRVQAGLSLARFYQDGEDTKDAMVYLNALLGGELLSLTPEQIREAVEIKRQEIRDVKSGSEKKLREKFFEMLLDVDEDDEVFESFVDTLQHQKTMADILAYCEDFELYGEKAERRREHSYPGVVLTTAHSSKGMEWPVVFCTVTHFDDKGLHEGKTKAQKDTLEEKRRLMFVAATRARQRLTITGVYAIGGKTGSYIFNQFLFEAFEIMGQNVDKMAVSDTITERKKLKKMERERERARKKAELLEKIGAA